MDTPFFSIILPTYNRANFISKAIESVLSQTFTDFELIIVDDGSKDTTKEIVTSYLTDSRTSYIFQENQERSIARNNGISNSKGQYICFLDSDDYYLPHHLSILFENIKSNNFPVAFFHTYQKYFKDGKDTNTVFYDNYQNANISETDCSLLNNVWLFSPAVQTSAVHKEIFAHILFETSTIPFECYELMGRIAAVYNIYKIKESTVIMQLHENNSTIYDLKFLEGYKNSFNYIIENPIYKNIRNHIFVKDVFYDIYIGLADCYSRNGNRGMAIKYLLKGLNYKRNLKNIRHLLGVTKNIISIK